MDYARSLNKAASWKTIESAKNAGSRWGIDDLKDGATLPWRGEFIFSTSQIF